MVKPAIQTCLDLHNNSTRTTPLPLPAMPAFRSIALALLLSGAHALCGQSIRDTTIALFAVHASYAQQLPGGDLAERFGTNSNIGLGTFRKTKSNFLLGVEGSFIFGKKTKEPGILRNVINSQGQVVDVEGKQADVFLYERGWTAFAYVGKTFQLGKPNPNSGVVIKLGGGYMRHKVRIQSQKNVVPQLEDEYLHGYDRLAAGPAAIGYVGYQYFGNKGRINFNIGLEFMAGFTQALRAYNFDTEQFNRPNRVDLLSGIRAGWSLPIYRKVDTGFHYY